MSGQQAEAKCSTCKDTGQVWTPEQDDSGMWDMACPDCDAPYPLPEDAPHPMAPEFDDWEAASRHTASRKQREPEAAPRELCGSCDAGLPMSCTCSPAEHFIATCDLCTWEALGESVALAGCLSSWHVYEEHPEAWRSLFGDRAPCDPDPRTPTGRQKILAEYS